MTDLIQEIIDNPKEKKQIIEREFNAILAEEEKKQNAEALKETLLDPEVPLIVMSYRGEVSDDDLAYTWIETENGEVVGEGRTTYLTDRRRDDDIWSRVTGKELYKLLIYSVEDLEDSL